MKNLRRDNAHISRGGGELCTVHSTGAAEGFAGQNGNGAASRKAAIWLRLEVLRHLAIVGDWGEVLTHGTHIKLLRGIFNFVKDVAIHQIVIACICWRVDVTGGIGGLVGLYISHDGMHIAPKQRTECALHVTAVVELWLSAT